MDYKNFIKKNIIIPHKSASYNRLCIFSHFDKDNKIDDYVVHYVSELHKAGCDIIFVSNCGEIEDKYLEKVKPHVYRIILRENKGYDFACYLTGFFEEPEREKFKQIIFANDSVYGPFYPLNQILEKFDSGYDVWGISDNIYAANYHLQSYFLLFNNKPQSKILDFLESFFTDFRIIDDKELIVAEYELGLSKKLIDKGYKLSALCKHEDILCFENSGKDIVISNLKNNIDNNFKNRVGFFKSFSKTAESKQIKLREYNLNSAPHYTSWYAQINYFGSPFIKISLLKDIRNVYYHNFLYREVIKNKYPQFDIELIDKHLKKVRNYDKNLIK